MIIFLIGFMGSGKSHIGPALAGLLKYQFIDTDELIEKKEKKSIKNIFETQGEEFFRGMEKKALHQLTRESKAVIATGGGMPCYSDNMELMNKSGITVYLEAEAGFLFHRLINEKSERPLISNLTDVELMEFISGTLGKRRNFYEQSIIKVNAEKITVQKLKEKIQKLKKKIK